MACPTFDAGTMKKQALILSLLAVYLIRQSSGYTLDHKHHAEPDLSYVPPTVEVPPPTVAPLCGCTEKGRCGETLRTFTELVIRTQASEVVCGSKAELCCYEDDPWPGYVDAFAHLAPCVPDHICKRPYGTVATDVRDFGAIGPCIGLGAVRCLDGLEGPPVPQPESPTHFVIPIIDNPTPPDEYYAPPPPPTTETPTTQPPVVYIPPRPTTQPPVVYVPPQPTTQPPVVYVPPKPTTQPPVVCVPPQPEPEPPAYAPPEPEPEPYAPPTPTYGVPQGQPLGYAYTSRFGYPYGYGGYYGGLRFRLRKYFGGVGFLG
ncbi:translation initiation factor IF-2 [Folsomia candida]|uniref:Actin cytoskeleton-regulatory complex protein PAN1 n=1 Tax=Folsomia candida TaxID=158441 RepID=A0A226EEN9_FOLCA|nr:translation initiation factor IF-2 [Folsomia candida]OXA55738.1 Actin cytoskeleton-regulatory complex protein PAN1 [Folsomia candida]